MLRQTISLFIFVFLSSCATNSVPTENSNFSESLEIKDLVGKYRNLGETADSSKYYLSKILWPGEKNIDHSKIELIEVKQIDNKSLNVVAIAGSQSLKKQDFVLGKNFEIKEGKITLKNSSGTKVLGTEGSGSIGVGVASVTETEVIGLDKHGHGKLKKNDRAVGVANIGLIYFLTFPVLTSR